MVAVNDPFIPLDYLVYQLKCDSVHGRLNGTIAMSEVDGNDFLMSRLVRVHVLCFRTLTFATPTYSDLYHLVPAAKSEPCSSDGREVSSKQGKTHCMNLSAPFIMQVPPFKAVLMKTMPDVDVHRCGGRVHLCKTSSVVDKVLYFC